MVLSIVVTLLQGADGVTNKLYSQYVWPTTTYLDAMGETYCE